MGGPRPHHRHRVLRPPGLRRRAPRGRPPRRRRGRRPAHRAGRPGTEIACVFTPYDDGRLDIALPAARGGHAAPRPTRSRGRCSQPSSTTCTRRSTPPRSPWCCAPRARHHHGRRMTEPVVVPAGRTPVEPTTSPSRAGRRAGATPSARASGSSSRSSPDRRGGPRRTARPRRARHAAPAARAVPRPPVPRPRRAARGPRPGRHDRPDQGGRPVRPRARRGVLDVRDPDDRRRDQAALPRQGLGDPGPAPAAGAAHLARRRRPPSCRRGRPLADGRPSSPRTSASPRTRCRGSRGRAGLLHQQPRRARRRRRRRADRSPTGSATTTPASRRVEYRESLRPLLAALPVARAPDPRAALLPRHDAERRSPSEVGISQMHVSRLLAKSLATLREGMIDDA